jgi:hypothetical protein
MSTRTISVIVTDDGCQYPAHLQQPEHHELNAKVLRAGIGAQQSTYYREAEALAKQLCDLKEEHQRQQKLCFQEGRRQGQVEHSELLIAVRQEKAALMTRLAVLSEEHQRQQKLCYQEGRQQGQVEHSELLVAVQQENAALASRLAVLNDTRSTELRTLQERLKSEKGEFAKQLTESSKRCGDLQLELERVNQLTRDLWKEKEQLAEQRFNDGVEAERKRHLGADKGLEGEMLIRNIIQKAFPECVVVGTSHLAHSGDCHVLVEGVRLLVEVKNTQTHEERWVSKFHRDVAACSTGNEPVHAGLYVSVRDTLQDPIRLSTLGTYPVVQIDGVGSRPQLVEAGIKFLVYTVKQAREEIDRVSDNTRELKALQDQLQMHVEGILSKTVKDLISAANTTLQRAKKLNDVFIAQLLDIIQRRPVAKRDKKRTVQVSAHHRLLEKAPPSSLTPPRYTTSSDVVVKAPPSPLTPEKRPVTRPHTATIQPSECVTGVKRKERVFDDMETDGKKPPTPPTEPLLIETKPIVEHVPWDRTPFLLRNLRNSLRGYLNQHQNDRVINVGEYEIVEELQKHGLESAGKSTYFWRGYCLDYLVRNFETKGLQWPIQIQTGEFHDVRGVSVPRFRLGYQIEPDVILELLKTWNNE